jgi:hypothetical protein
LELHFPHGRQSWKAADVFAVVVLEILEVVGIVESSLKKSRAEMCCYIATNLTTERSSEFACNADN